MTEQTKIIVFINGETTTAIVIYNDTKNITNYWVMFEKLHKNYDKLKNTQK